MSRCFPYPPPGFTVNRAGEAGLIESIKLQKEKKKSKEGKKDSKRKEKKERRVKEVQGNADGKKDEITHKSDMGKGQFEKSELLERSGLSEEHEQPTCLYESSTSYESTNNTKRKFSVVFGNHEHGTMIKIRLLPPKTINEHVCSTSGRTDLPTRDKVEFGLNNKQEDHPAPSGLTPRTDDERIDLNPQNINCTVPARILTSALPVPTASKQSKEYLKYKYLTEDCLLKHTFSEPEDLSWLFCSKNEGKQPEKRRKLENNIMTCSTDLCQPSSHCLPEASLFALPYTIPF